ncbi:MAG: hypothetical protein CMJ46_12340 [Planctomyces sp.]|nr:hypothetical protein [Planctomyces sp.]
MRYCLIAVCFGLLGILASEGRADWGNEKPAGCCDTACSGCSKVLVCCPSVKMEEVEETCFEVECEHICVPQVKVPWGKILTLGCCFGDDECEPLNPGCGKIIAVNKLKKEKNKVEKAVCVWEIKEVDQIGCCKP